jgi:hypothetical protein
VRFLPQIRQLRQAPQALEEAPLMPTDLRRLLVLTSPMLHGSDVERVQRDLRLRHVDPGPVDGAYGPATEHAVLRFQRQHGLEVDGVVGPRTWAALRGQAATRPPAHQDEHRHPAHLHERLGAGAVEWMLHRRGIGEHPPGSNHNAITEEFRLDRQPWCAMTVSLAFKHGEGLVLGRAMAHHGHPPAGYWSDRGFAYVPYLEAWGKAAGFWIGKSHPIRGDIIIFRWPGQPQPDHTGLATGPMRNGLVPTVEGNTDDNLLTRDRRWDATIVGLIRVRAYSPGGASAR